MTQPAPIPFPPLKMPDALDRPAGLGTTGSATPGAKETPTVPARLSRPTKGVSRLPLTVPGKAPVWPPGVD